MTMMTPQFRTVIGLLFLVAAAGCGANVTEVEVANLPPIALKSGCTSCHGIDGQGGVGPSFAGVFGSIVELDDGSTVIADRDYLIESIKDPAAKKVAGYRLRMPTNRLTDDEIDQIVTYIEALATPADGSRQ